MPERALLRPWNADQVVDEGEEEVLADVVHRCAAQHARSRSALHGNISSRPVAMPTSASARAGASLTPSPAIATEYDRGYGSCSFL